jgi:hypothetical protein
MGKQNFTKNASDFLFEAMTEGNQAAKEEPKKETKEPKATEPKEASEPKTEPKKDGRGRRPDPVPGKNLQRVLDNAAREPKTVHANFIIPGALDKKIKHYAKKHNLSKNALVCAILEDYLGEEAED